MIMASSEPERQERSVTSIHGVRYRLSRKLGSGGQGAVFAIEGERLAVKLLRDASPRRREALRDRLAMVGRLPLDDLPVARPMEQLRPPHVGYVMELVTGMQSLRELMRPPRGTTALAPWYAHGGGLRRRLRLLAHLADVLARLHGRGLIYVDPSPANVFVSTDIESHEIRLIDVDNLRASSVPGDAMYTPYYGAPEIVRGTGPATSLSDAHAFAVMAFETLALTHPLIGDLVHDGEPELEDEALLGNLPWIDDPEDDRNRSSHGLPRELVLSKHLREDFAQTFGPGLSQPAERPGMSRWAEHLHRAADRTLTCPACSGSFYMNCAACPWCSAPRPSFAIAAVLRWDPERVRPQGTELAPAAGLVREPDSARHRIVDAVALGQDEDVILTDRITHGTTNTTPRLRVRFGADRIVLERLDDGPWRLVAPDGHQHILRDRPESVSMRGTNAAWLLHAGPGDRLHRVLRFDLQGVRR